MENAEARNSLKTLKRKNRHRVLEYIRGNAAVSVAAVAEATGLSKMTVHKIIGHHLGASLIAPAGKGLSTEEGGKKPNLYAFNPNYRYIFAVKIVERQLSSALANLRGEIASSHTALYDRDTDLADILKMIRWAFHSLIKRQRISEEDCIGAVVGCHGIIDVDQGVCVISPHFVSWGSDVPIRDRIAEVLPRGMPVYVDNWLRYHAYGEMKAGAAADRGRFFLIGTEWDGLAGALVIDGRIYRGNGGLAGEIGHMVVDPANPDVCACGGVGCLEVAVSPNRLASRAMALRRDWPDSVLFRVQSRRDVSFANILKASNRGDGLACALIDGSARHFAVAVNNVVQVCDPGLVIIQGEYAQAGDYFLNRLRDRVRRMTLLRMDKSVDIEYSSLGDECTLNGSAHFLADQYFAGMDAN
ncbi:MAG: ROK family protein [Planctomycetota bacterium]|jgi:predicted NBD/HSP70 family sugar kinase|nr:ROK family protein [Planctomycetota bacterium]